MRPTRLFRKLLGGVVMTLTIITSTEMVFGQQEERAQISQADFNKLIQQLNSNSLSEREVAEERLEQTPQSVWDNMSTDLKLSAETRKRIERIRQKVETKFAKDGAEASLITLAERPSLHQTLNALSAQSGNQIEIRETPDAPLSINVNAAPFWSAFDQLLDKANLDVSEYLGSENRSIELTSRAPGRPPRADATYAGVFRIEPAGITARNSRLNPKLSSLRVDLAIAWEPRLKPIQISLPMEHVTAVLDNGEKLRPENLDAEPLSNSTAGTLQTEIEVTLPMISRDVKVINELHGRIKATLPGRLTTLKVPLDSREPVTRGAVTFHLEQVRKAGVLDEVRFRVKFDDPGDSLQSHQSWVFENEAYILDKEGKRLERLGLEVFSQSEDEVGIGILFELGDRAEGATFVYETPLAIVSSEWPFTVRNITLP